MIFDQSVIPLNQTMTMSLESSSIIIPVLLGICLSIIAIITALGNIVVLLAFYCDKKLRTINDYFILNMAIADFLVGFFCIPFYVPFSITQIWPFGRLFCKIWVTVDDVSTMASVINIVAISINRYWSIAYPLSYRKYVRQHFVYIVMTGIWCFSFFNFAPGIWLLSLFNPEMNITRRDCSGDYNNSFVYMLIAQFNYFIWPFIVLCVLNMLLMLNIWKRSRKMVRLSLKTQPIKMKEENLPSTPLGTSRDLEDDQQQRLSILSKHQNNSNEQSPSIMLEENSLNQVLPPLFHQDLSSIIPRTSSNLKSPSTTRYSTRNESPRINHFNLRSPTIVQFSLSVNHRNTSLIEESIMEHPKIDFNELSTSDRSRRTCREIRTGQSRIDRDRKAARSLFILVIVFLIFLFPYVICATALTAGIDISSWIFETSFWLLWLNSTCNPFLYPFIQMKYRRAYQKLFQSAIKSCSSSRSNTTF